MQKPPVHHGGSKRHQAPLGPSSRIPSPTPPPCCLLQLSRESSFRGGGKHLLRPLPCLCLELCQEGSAGQKQETEKEGKKGDSHQLSGRRLSGNATRAPWALWKLGALGGGEAVGLQLLSPEHHPAHGMS